jgi:hypothetical protein
MHPNDGLQPDFLNAANGLLILATWPTRACSGTRIRNGRVGVGLHCNRSEAVQAVLACRVTAKEAGDRLYDLGQFSKPLVLAIYVGRPSTFSTCRKRGSVLKPSNPNTIGPNTIGPNTIGLARAPDWGAVTIERGMKLQTPAHRGFRAGERFIERGI